MAHRSRLPSWIAGSFGLVLVVAACGPIEYVGQVTRKASTAVTAAKAVDADKYSPYYYTLAVEYLHKARVKAASADFQAANRFGRKSERAAKMAKTEALERAGKPLDELFPNLHRGDPDRKLAPLEEPADELAPLVEEGGADDADGADKPEDEEVPPGLGGEE